MQQENYLIAATKAVKPKHLTTLDCSLGFHIVTERFHSKKDVINLKKKKKVPPPDAVPPVVSLQAL